MKRALLATAALSTVFIGNTCFAADLGARFRAPPVAPVPLFTWTGCYIGGHLGGGWGEKTVSVPSLAPGVSVTGDTSGFLGGGQVGCNLQYGSNWVIGIEGDGSGSDIRGDITQLARQRDWPARLGVGSLAVICQGRRSLGWRQVFGIHSCIQRAIGSERDPNGLDGRWRHRVGVLEQLVGQG
jgi:opacity protein-like surface antigen